MSYPEPVEIVIAALRRYRDMDLADERRGLDDSVKTMGEIMRTGPNDVVNDTLARPIWNALRGLVRDQGWRIYANGGSQALSEAFRQVEDELDDGDDMYCSSVLEKWWIGIGRQGDEWNE